MGRLFQILTDVFGQENLGGLKKIEGQEVLLLFPKMSNASVIIKIINCRIIPIEYNTHTPHQTVIEFWVEVDEIVPLLNDIIRSPANLRGIIKIVGKYVITRKLKPKGSLRIILPILKALMTGNHNMYKMEKMTS
ncbi:MAG: hypothetical protein JW776_16575 [Candidatus Lokiarchaeota archaeon]|nr:hypothetical protein [Candidatus Lokiarchaeota archaeon]